MPAKKVYPAENDTLWYKDAIIYELHVKTFCDSNNDGIGDFKGLISKLDYLKSLGITAVWLLPFYPSPLKDDGYDIADYFSIHPTYGTLGDFKDFLKQAHKRGIRVITELVINHTSDQHPWFQKSRQAYHGSAWRNFYVWSATPEKYKDARVIFKDFEGSNWTWDSTAASYYWHRFYSHQPDLNYDNPRVHKAILSVLDFWLGMGVDGMRLDAVPYLYEREDTNCENLPETHVFLKKLRAHVDKKFKNKMILAEANQWSEDAAGYFGNGDECHMAFNFPVMPRMFIALQMEDRFPIIDILDPPPPIPENCQWALFLRNHDELTLEMVTDEERDYMYRVYAQDPRVKINLGIRKRLAPLLGNSRRRIELMNVLLFSLPGTPVIYYGDEIGMGDNHYLGDRNGVRTPMQWSPDRNAGFSKANPQQLYLPVIIDPEYHYEAINVENQERNLGSLLWWMKRVLVMRKHFKSFSRGEIQFLSPHNPKILAFVRRCLDEIILVVINLSRFSQVTEIDLSGYAGFIPEEVFSRNQFPPIKKTPYILTLGPHNYYWFLLRKKREVIRAAKPTALPRIFVKESGKDVFEKELKETLEQEVLIPYLLRSRWFGDKGRVIRKVRILEHVLIKENNFLNYLLILELHYKEGISNMYLLPLFFASRDKWHLLQQQFPQALIASVKTDKEDGFFYDGAYSQEFQESALEMIARRKKLKAAEGEFIFYPSKKFKNLLGAKKLPLKSSVLATEQSNTSIIYENTFILKLFRKLERGLNPDAEIVKMLNEKVNFGHIPSFAGAIEYRQEAGGSLFVSLLQGFLPNATDAWLFTLDNVSKFFERVLSRKAELKNIPKISAFFLEEDFPEEYLFLNDLIGAFFLEMVGLLGRRTAELHLALSSLSDEGDFVPEPFSLLYQRSVYQSMMSLTRGVFHLLQDNINKCSKELKLEAAEILASQGEILKRLAKILEKKISAMKIRIHGDYHLGQVLFTGKDFVIIDFEGEPQRPLSERRLKRSPLRDIAGMVRSFHYAAYAGLLKHQWVNQEDKNFLELWIKAWYHYISSVFLRSYLVTTQDAQFLPKKREEFMVIFEAFLLEKAVYELGYELNNRPDWIIIPLRGLKYILKGMAEDK
ncbi:MAG: maltose alpha-D-glucosyltransferase [Candidatus Omnitrophota bacterium]